MKSYGRDGGSWPSGVCLQGSASNRLERHWLKTVVVSVEGKGLSLRQVRCESRRRVQANPRSGIEIHTMASKPGDTTTAGKNPAENLPTGWVVSGVKGA